MSPGSSPSLAAPPTHLIVVCCHGIWLGGPSAGHDEAEWLIAPFQAGETPTFVRHIEEGVRAHADDVANSVLVFSGAATRPETRLSEAQSYANVAAQNAYFGHLPSSSSSPSSPSSSSSSSHDGALPTTTTILLEERALDSFSNVLFSMTLFRARVGAWPASLTVVGHAFKRPRMEMHVAAVGFPAARTRHVGVDPPGVGRLLLLASASPSASPSAAAAAAAARRGADANEDGVLQRRPQQHQQEGQEWEDHPVLRGIRNAEREWREDPHGRGESLAGKRRGRNAWAAWQGVFEREVTDRGGLETVGEGEAERLVDEARRPWL
ncbi:hypothetical protein VFPBJ_02296 [Purpureocillium lilacinum]|uniref:DUF218 domain-containing protein n=1 Tax=Purpureocillium lilacinum TaxID=33203 RepID=A0A179H1G0_PURLI|nr:hypothetical protein VFPBJ_02296 [Purpureocillium lilacinum]